MKMPRLTISRLMAIVALVALNFAAFRALSGLQLIVLGGIPMANILGITYIVLRLRPSKRPFLLGFEMFGLIALGVYALTALPHEDDIVRYYIGPIFDPIQRRLVTPGSPATVLALVIMIPLVVAQLVLPQLVLALLGGYFSSRYRIIRRTAVGAAN